ncbi:MAG: hypothetical protein K8W52_02040 [Deltaproteobacteria bacterium]|nr:hypothetical protein [Deltaproteobacteria bacterium]
MKKHLGILTLVVALMGVPRVAGATNYILHFGGMCSQTFTDTAPLGGGGRVAAISGWTSINAAVDQRTDFNVAVSQVVARLNTYCGAGNTCRLYGYSNGGAAISKALSVYGNGQWNIAYVMTVGSAEGGSELAGTGWLAQIIGGCAMASQITTSSYRNGWNHNDTDGKQTYMLAGTKAFSGVNSASSALLPGQDDGAVAMHSSGGYATTGSWNDACQAGRYSYHSATYWCAFYLNHYEIKMRGITCGRWRT